MASGTFEGHLLPGIAFILWGSWWLIEIVRAGGKAPVGASVEQSLIPPIVKIVLAPLAVVLEMPNEGWEPMDAVMGWHHATAYVGFGLSGVVDVFARRGLLSARATHLALAAAAFNGAFLFYGHGNGPGTEAVAHSLLVVGFTSVGAFALLRTAVPSWPFEWLLTGSMLGLGAWWCVTAWILFRSGWDPADPVREGWVYVSYAWTIMGVAILLTCARLWTRRGPPRERAVHG
jgi:hypothetical protein